jgi:hypothetical protein
MAGNSSGQHGSFMVSSAERLRNGALICAWFFLEIHAISAKEVQAIQDWSSPASRNTLKL